MWLRWLTKRHYFWRSWIVSLDLKDTEASFLPNSTDSRCLQVAQVPRSRDMAIFVLMMMTTTITLPSCTCARGNNHCKLLTWVQALHQCMHTSLANQRVKGYYKNAHGMAAKHMYIPLELKRSHYRCRWPALTIFATMPKVHVPRVINTYIVRDTQCSIDT